jgi:probable phosphoglycerate mutase
MSDNELRIQLLLIRHGQSFYNRDGEEAGMDSGLTSLGWAQARRVADWLVENEAVDVLYSSSMLRARQTAEVIGQQMGLSVIVQAGFEEARQSYWDELPRYRSPHALQPESGWTLSSETTPHYHALIQRLWQALEPIMEVHPGQTVAIVGHGGAWATLVRSLTGGHNALISTENGAVHKLIWRFDRWMLAYLNRNEHLRDVDVEDAADRLG